MNKQTNNLLKDQNFIKLDYRTRLPDHAPKIFEQIAGKLGVQLGSLMKKQRERVELYTLFSNQVVLMTYLTLLLDKDKLPDLNIKPFQGDMTIDRIKQFYTYFQKIYPEQTKYFQSANIKDINETIKNKQLYFGHVKQETFLKENQPNNFKTFKYENRNKPIAFIVVEAKDYFILAAFKLPRAQPKKQQTKQPKSQFLEKAHQQIKEAKNDNDYIFNGTLVFHLFVLIYFQIKVYQDEQIFGLLHLFGFLTS